ncbi:hypothetical protein HDV57DRAFT_185789 [Trichoderma longibrachiatum]
MVKAQHVRFSTPVASALWLGTEACPNRLSGTVLLAAALKRKTGREATHSLPEAAASRVGRLVAYGDMTRRDAEMRWVPDSSIPGGRLNCALNQSAAATVRTSFFWIELECNNS